MGKKVADILKGLKESEHTYDIVLVHIDSFYVMARCSPGILSLATFLRREGFSVRVLSPLDFYCLSMKSIEDFFREARPSIIGFYTNSDNIYSVMQCARKIQSWRLAPRPRLIAGGPLASAQREEIPLWPLLDALIYGEAEYSLASYAKAVIRHQGTLNEVPSLIYHDGGASYTNPPMPLIEDLDTLPAVDQSFAGSSPQVITISSGRGCPFGCAFCFQAVHGRRYRHRSPEKVVAEIVENLEKYDRRIFSISDDTFVAQPARVHRICDLLMEYRKRSGRDFRFYCEGRVDILARHENLLPHLREAGLIRLQIGIESGDQNVIDAYGKGILLEEVEGLVDRAQALGDMSVIGHFIIGGAFETEESFEKSLAFARRLIKKAPGVFETGAGFMCCYPGTDIWRDPGKYDLTVREAQFRDSISTLDATCETGSLSIERLRLMKQRFHREIDHTMRKSVPSIPFETVRNQVQWASRYGLTTFWHPYLAEREGLSRYFFFASSPRFFRLSERQHDLEDTVPMRTVGMLVYGNDGRTLLLSGGMKKIRLREGIKSFIYRRSCGKQTMGEIAEEIRALYHPGRDIKDIIQSLMVPFYSMLEKNYSMTFFE